MKSIGTVFKKIRRKVENDGSEFHIMTFDFICNSFEEAKELKKRIESKEEFKEE